MSKTTASENVAFSAGSDARIAGLPIDANPCLPGSRDHIHWIRGWKDCHLNFGEEARWPCIDLPDLQKIEAA